ncbi:AbrB/MazE/SpoVT family DNA-binding domain-containing protein [Patescibacteria group bacterium]|nr:AbrB/MazE/SpoVT family DNA-binding domain-containing protein [Patescibacteria group bacterium]MBU1951303.1 AbrB/MazE/SpoVT family DNA-binding domain-containing protein [Patescibacteria group bacterium]MBU2229587.1 AbrB/MazE/SpoVT family DNA-binding domain-containing protein [Patescibacteria group bacterium]
MTKEHIHKDKDHKVCGTTTVGERGQVVIPAEVRKRMNLETGDKLLVFCKLDKFVGLVKSDDIDKLLDKMTEKMVSRVEKIRKDIKGAK